MAHVNYKRGETRTFVFRREHGVLTHRTYHKGKRDSWKVWKQDAARRRRRVDRMDLRAGRELRRWPTNIAWEAS